MKTKVATLIIIVAILLSSIGTFLYVMAPSTPANTSETELVLPFTNGSSFTLLYRVMVTVENDTRVVEEVEDVFSVIEPGFPFTRVKTLDGIEKNIPTIFLAVPRELTATSFYTPISTKLLGETLCIQLSPKSSRLVGGTPGSCKSVFVEVRYNEYGLTDQAIFYGSIGGSIYSEHVYVVARSVSGETVVKAKPLCITMYSQNILFATPGLYYFDTHGGRYVLDTDYGKYKPLLIILKTPENQQVWESLPGRYVGYVLLVSPLLVDIDKIPELERVMAEKIVYLE